MGLFGTPSGCYLSVLVDLYPFDYGVSVFANEVMAACMASGWRVKRPDRQLTP
jgi:hypothetical protein